MTILRTFTFGLSMSVGLLACSAASSTDEAELWTQHREENPDEIAI